jgi:CubicO group peptidase (beta-lactamase class C family)
MIAKINAVVAQEMLRERVPGATVAVTRNGVIIFANGYGRRTLDHMAPADAATHFEIGSITKQFTAAAMLQLKEANRISLNDRLSKYVPDFPHARQITLLELLGQTSGLPDYVTPSELIHGASALKGYDSAVAAIRDRPLVFAPGTSWGYSNTNYIALGRVIEVVSGVTYEAYVRTHLFAPADMRETVTIDDEPRLNDMAMGYRIVDGAVRASPASGPTWFWSAGEFVSTVGDLAKWDAALASGKIVSATDYHLMQAGGRTSTRMATDYGFAWFVDTYGAHPRVWHSGLTLGFDAVNVVFPSDQIAIIALVNNGNADAMALANDVFGTLIPAAAAAQRRIQDADDRAVLTRAQNCLDQLRNGNLDRSQLNPQLNHSLTPQMLAQTAAQLRAWGKPTSLSLVRKTVRGGISMFVYRARFATAGWDYVFGLDSAGKIATLQLSP